MTYAQVSPKFQIVIPKEMRERLAIKPRHRLIVIEKGGVIHLIPDLPVKKLKGLFKDSDLTTDGLRDKTDRL